MAKDRNTFAKHQRALDKKHKADKKRERRAKKGQNANPPDESETSLVMLSSAERSVLRVFRTSLTAEEKMLSFGPKDLETFKMPLAQLAGKGLLVAEDARGFYSLTESGLAAMQDGE